MKKRILTSVAAAFAVGAFADTFYWVPDAGTPAAYADAANWRLGSADGAAATVCPGAGDTLYGRQNFNFDLGGETHEISTWDTTHEWARYKMTLANGTLKAKDGVYTHSGTVNVLSGAKWIIDGEFRPAQGDAGQHIVNVEDGGEFQVNGAYRDYKSEFHIKAGGRYVYNPTKFVIYWGSAQNSFCEIAGVMDAPRGVNWTESGYGNDWNYYDYRLKDGGVLNVGGDFNRNGQRGKLMLSCESGRIAATADVSFIQTDCTLAADKTLAVDVVAGATVDMTPFVCGTGSAIVKTGDGSIRLGASVPFRVTLDAGRLVVAGANAALEGLPGAGGVVEIAAPGFALNGEVSEGVSFVLAPGVFMTGDVFFTSFDAAVRAKVKADVEAAGMSVAEDGYTLKLGASAYVFNSTETTDLFADAGWQTGSVPPEGAEVTIAGADVVADFAAGTLPFSSVTVKDGATLRVSGTALELPPVRLVDASTFEVTGSATADAGLAFVAGESGACATVKVGPGASLALPGGTVFKNCAVDLKGALTATSAGGFVFGGAAADEETTFAMTADGATITVVNPSGAANGSRIDFAVPAAGGTVHVQGPITLRNTTVNPDKTRDGIVFGLGNPVDETFQVVADNTTLNCGWDSFVAGGATLVLDNYALLLRARHGEGDNADYYYNLTVQDYGRITLRNGGEIRAGVSRVNGDLVDGAIHLNPAEPGWTGLEVLEGGIGCWYKLNGHTAGKLCVADGTIECFKSYWWGWDNRNHLFNGLVSVDIPEAATMTFKGVEDKLATSDRRLSFFELEAPFSGAGDLVFVNTWQGHTMEPTLFRGDNTCTGALLVEDGEGTAKTQLHFADGANWAGCVTLNGNVDLVPADANRPTAADNPTTVTFGGANLVAPMPIRVWVTKDAETGLFTITNDVINVGALGWTVGEAGGLAPSTQTAVGLGDLPPNTRLVLGFLPKGGTVPPSLSALLVLERETCADDEAADLLVARTASGAFVFTGANGSTDLNDATGWECGYVPVGEEVTIRGADVTARLDANQGLPYFASIALREGATLQIVGKTSEETDFVLPSVSADAFSALVVGDDVETATTLALPSIFVTSAENDGANLTKLTVKKGATLVVAGGTKFKDIAIELNGTVTKGAGVVDGTGPVFGYADADETTYFAFTGDMPQFQIHSNQNQYNGQVAFVNPAVGGRVKVVGDIRLKNAFFPVNGWADFGLRVFGVNNPTDEPFTVVLDGTKVDSPWSFLAGGAARVKLVNGSMVEKNWGCRNHGFDNCLQDAATVEVCGSGSYLDYIGGNNCLRVKSNAGVDAVRVVDGGTYLAPYAEGTGNGVFASANGVLGVGKLADRERGPLLKGFGSVRVEEDSALTIKALDLGLGYKDWERRVTMADIPITGAGDVVVDNALEEPFAVTLVNGANTCTGTLRVADVADTELFLANGVTWAGSVLFNGHVAFTNLTAATAPVTVSLGGARLSGGNLILRVWKQDESIVTDTLNLTGAVTADEDEVVELVPQPGTEAIVPHDIVPLGTAPAGAYANVRVKTGGHTMNVFETPTSVPGIVYCTARLSVGTLIRLR